MIDRAATCRLSGVVAMAIALVGCGRSDSPTQPKVPEGPNILQGSAAVGHVAFLASCASCHASRDGFDLAFFGFGDSNVVRRAVRHVSRDTAIDIAAYIRSLSVQARGRDFRLFQPGGAANQSDADFWTSRYGGDADRWPATLTVASLRSLNLRAMTVPLPFIVWSSEGDDDDWLPDTPLDPVLLGMNGGALRRSLDAYYASPSDVSLLAFINMFRGQVRGNAADAAFLCYGEVGAQPRANECFQAMRWASSLAAMHFVRNGRTENVPLDVAHLWWETGEAAVSTNFSPRDRIPTQARTRRTAAWLYLAFTYAPMEFREDNGYMGQFLQTAGFSRMALVSELRRMVGDGGVHVPDPSAPMWDAQRFWDGSLAVLRAPDSLKYPTALFVLDYLISRIKDGETYRPEAMEIITNSLNGIDLSLRAASSPDPETRIRVDQDKTILGTLIPTAIRR